MRNSIIEYLFFTILYKIFKEVFILTRGCESIINICSSLFILLCSKEHTNMLLSYILITLSFLWGALKSLLADYSVDPDSTGL